VRNTQFCFELLSKNRSSPFIPLLYGLLSRLVPRFTQGLFRYPSFMCCYTFSVRCVVFMLILEMYCCCFRTYTGKLGGR